MARIIPLFSGSKGNSYFIGSSGEGVLIDAGRSCKQLEQALAQNGVNISSIGAIFITHEHTDHCMALKVFAKRHGLRVFASAGTLETLAEKGLIAPDTRAEVISDSISVGNMQAVRCDTPHDARESCCFQVFTPDGRRATIATDIGIMTDGVRALLRDSDFVVIESNHDIGMLKSGPYPPAVKARILSDRGHLSNDACSAELGELVRCGVSRIMLGHLSEQNNLPSIALDSALGALAAQGMKQNLDFTLAAAPVISDGSRVIF